MRKFLVAGVVAIAAITTVGAGAATAEPAPTGKVTVFSHEFSKVTEWENPSGCQKLPMDAHVLVNDTDKPVRTFMDPFCLAPTLTVEPAHGAHVMPGTGSFSVQR